MESRGLMEDSLLPKPRELTGSLRHIWVNSMVQWMNSQLFCEDLEAFRLETILKFYTLCPPGVIVSSLLGWGDYRKRRYRPTVGDETLEKHRIRGDMSQMFDSAATKQTFTRTDCEWCALANFGNGEISASFDETE